ncbi:hypothetical protein [Methyloversatilis sp.]|uniref:hypothetical protein n=1 Tax=Methyloversatilis sp. TaxID=2569862 RepID=UPI002737022B|nr:hypothetical protein [Methyloversatilis sp.]MDP2870779.1 hypothetical protein [Methyloversatilis sp.]MDP3288724.1 hypothetical protein [Methyloversatilis sp.]MDP3456244.1 hypothetical protein [Methyloversatilis sp.]MDP3579377.1 hypothetical protein [Methyloversatilis sp.]
MALDKVLLGRLLQLNEPWTVRDFRFDPDARKLDAWVGVEPPRGWFARVRRQPAEGPERVWRHVDLAGWRCHVHVQAPIGADLSALPWAGALDMPFSQALSKHVFALFNEGVPLNGICTITGIPLQELWKFKYSLDQGKTAIATPASPLVDLTPAGSVAPAALADDIPDLTDPVWLKLIEGQVDLDIRALSLKLLMTRLRSQLEVITDEEVRMLKLRELHRYFVKNARMLGHELSQLRAS